MKKIIFIVFLFFFLGCSKVPVSGRKQLNLLPESELIQMSSQQYDQFINQAYIVENTPESELVVAPAGYSFTPDNNPS